MTPRYSCDATGHEVTVEDVNGWSGTSPVHTLELVEVGIFADDFESGGTSA